MSDTLKKVNTVLVSDGETSASANSLLTITKGDLLIFDSKGNQVDTAAKATALGKLGTITIAVGTGPGKFLLSSPIQGNTVSQYEGFPYAAPTEKVLFLGYDGTSVSKNFETTPGEEYRLRVNINADQLPGNGQREPYYDANYTSSSDEAPVDVALALQTLITAKDYGHAFLQDLVSVEVITKNTAGSSVNALVINGSTNIVFEAAHGKSTGDYISIDGATYKVYNVIDDNTLCINAPYQGVTAGSIAVDAVAEVVNAGIKITALPQEESLAVYSEYEQVLFDAFLTDANDLASVQYTAPKTKGEDIFAGRGYWKQVRDAEEFAKPYQGQLEKRSFDSKLIASNVDPEATYETVLIGHAAIVNDLIVSNGAHANQTSVYVPTGGQQVDDGTANSFINILNAFMAVQGQAAIDLA
jgi:hypothetical protein